MLGRSEPREATAPASGAGVVAIAVVSVAASLLLLEVLLRLHPQLAVDPSLARELGWRARHARRSTGQPTNWQIDRFSPLLGWELRANLRLDGLTSNGDGIRGSREYPSMPEAGTGRVVCVGDSFTFGQGQRDEDTMPARLEVELNSVGPPRSEVINLGVHGYGTDQQWLRLSRDGFRYHPAVVVLGFFEEDLERNGLAFRDYAKPYFTLDGGRLVLRNVPVPAPDDVLARPPSLPLVYIASLLASLPKRFASWRDPAHTPAGRVTLAILDTMRAAVAERDARFVLMTIPRTISRRGTTTERLLVGWAERTGTPVLNLRTAYLAMPADVRRRLYHGHWTAEGAAVTARLLARRVRGAMTDPNARMRASMRPIG